MRAGDQMRLLLIGAPGAGKGTQAERLAERFGIAHISSGDLLRQHVRDRTSLGQTIKSYVDKGNLVPDGVVMDMLRKPVVTAAEAGGYVLDGFPRTVEQAKASFPTARALGAEVQAAIHLDVAREELRAPPARPAPRLGRYRSRHREPPAGVPGQDRAVARVFTPGPGMDVHGRRGPCRRTPCTRTSSPASRNWRISCHQAPVSRSARYLLALDRPRADA